MNSECKKVCNFVTLAKRGVSGEAPSGLQPVFEKMGKELSGPFR